MNPQHLSMLQGDFDLGDVVSCTECDEGVLNKNYILTTATGTYFVKQLRSKGGERVAITAAAEELMRRRGIPAVCMLISKRGERCAVYDGLFYCVYHFIESDRSHAYALSDYRTMGALLGKIHQAGSYDIPPEFKEYVLHVQPKESIVKALHSYSERIQGFKHRQKIDDAFLAYIGLKLTILPEISRSDYSEGTLVHGDYHAGNLLLDAASRDIIGVCDWEKAMLAPRAYELARSTIHICFDEGYDESAGLVCASHFLAGYSSVYPISREEFSNGLQLRMYHMVCSIWIEKQHYDLDDLRSDHFVTHESKLIQSLVRGDLAKKVIGVLTDSGCINDVSDVR